MNLQNLNDFLDKINILLIDDDEEDMIITRDFLEEIRHPQYNLTWVSTFNKGLIEISKNYYDVCLIDYRLGRKNGLELIQNAIEMGCESAIILLTGLGDKEIDLEAMRIGASDYLVKGEINSQLLDRSIRYSISRKRNKIALQKSEERAVSIFEHSPVAIREEDFSDVKKYLDGLNIDDPDELAHFLDNPESIKECISRIKILNLNKATLDLYKAKDKEFFINNIKSSILKSHLQSISNLKDLLLHLLKGQTPFTLNSVQYSFDGSKLDTIFHVSIPPGYENSLSRIYVSIIDVTELKKTENALRQSEEKLLQAQKMEAIGRLAGGVAHDFNNILTAIIGYSDFIIDSLVESDPLRSDAVEIKLAALRAASTTSKLLAFTKKQILELEYVNLGEVIMGMKNLLSRIVGKNISIKIKLANKFDQIKVNLDQLEQIILNLIINAKDAIIDGGEILLEIYQVSYEKNTNINNYDIKAGNYIVLKIADNGVGMDDNIKTQIFEPFFTTKAIGKGTGLGLSTVYGVVSQFNGYITVESEVNVGTIFEIYFPSIPNTDKIKPIINQIHKTILVVNNRDPLLKLIIKVLKSKNFNVLEAIDSEMVLKISKESNKEIDLLITDFILPKIGGLELGNELLRQRPKIKILFITGFVDVNFDKYMEKNMNYISKPFTLSDLTKKIEICLIN